MRKRPPLPVQLGYFPFIERLLVEASIEGKLDITSQQNVILRVSIGPDPEHPAQVDYRGTWDDAGNQCDWSALITSQSLRVGGTSCLTAPPYYQSANEWRDTILVGGTDASNDAKVYATRGGTPADPPDCGPGVTTNCNCPNGSPCHSVSRQQVFTLTPLAAAIRLKTPNVTEVAPKTILLPDPLNGSTTFKVSSTPTTYRGITVPTQALSWRWVPSQSDSSGSVTAQCPVPPTASLSNTCSVTLYETGMMIVNARVNGVPQTDTLKVVGPQVRLIVPQAKMLPSVTQTTADVHYPSDQLQTLQVSVIDTLGVTLKNRWVQLRLSAVEGTAGHAHQNTSTYPKPPGTFPPAGTIVSVNTGNTTGIATVVYRSPDPSGPVWIQALSSGAGTAKKKIDVQVDGLQQFNPGSTADLTGDRPEHPSNHWATSAHIANLNRLIWYFARQWPTEKLTFNDSSLPLGGLYDINAHWTIDHVGHRWGNNTDLKTYDNSDPQHPVPTLTDPQKNFVKMVWMDLAGGPKKIIEHKPGGRVLPHLHLIY